MRTLLLTLLVSLAVASPPAWAQSAAGGTSAALKTAPGVVVRTAPPSRLDVALLDRFTPSFMNSTDIGRVGLPAGFVRTPSLSDSLLGIGDAATLTFTPSGNTGDGRSFSLGLTSRVRDGNRIVSTTSGGRATSQNVAVTMGYAGFALEAGYNRLAQTSRPMAEGMNVGVSYRGSDWKTGLMLSESAVGPDVFGLPGVFAPENSRSVELGAAYELTSWLAINGGLRYEIFNPKSQLFGTSRGAAQFNAGAIYLGTQLKF